MKIYWLLVIAAVVAIVIMLKKKEGLVVPPMIDNRESPAAPIGAISGLSDAYFRSPPVSDPSMFKDMVPVDEPEQVSKDKVHGEFLTPQDLLGDSTMADPFSQDYPDTFNVGVALKSRFVSPSTVWNIGADYIPPVNSVHSFRDVGLGDAPRHMLSKPLGGDEMYSYEVTKV